MGYCRASGRNEQRVHGNPNNHKAGLNQSPTGVCFYGVLLRDEERLAKCTSIEENTKSTSHEAHPTMRSCAMHNREPHIELR